MLFEFLPLLLFFGAWYFKGIYFALVVLMIAMPIGVLAKYVHTKKLDKIYFWSTIFLLVAGSLTLYFRNPMFLYWKPTVFYWVLAGVFLISQFIGDMPLVVRFFKLIDGLELEKVTRSQWQKLNIAWVLFFVFAGLSNIYVAYNFEQAWPTFKVFGLMGLTFLFMLGQTFWLSGLISTGGDEPQQEQD